MMMPTPSVANIDLSVNLSANAKERCGGSMALSQKNGSRLGGNTGPYALRT